MGEVVKPSVTPQPAIEQSSSPTTKCWRLIYDDNRKVVVSLFEAQGEQKTSFSLFVSNLSALDGQKECLDFITAHGLSIMLLPPNTRFAVQPPMTQHVPEHGTIQGPAQALPNKAKNFSIS